MQIKLPNVTIAFPALAEAQAIGDGEPAYGARFIIDPKSDLVKQIDAAMLDVAKKQWKEDGPSVLDMLREEGKVAFEKKAYRSKKTGKVYDGFEGTFSLGSRNPKAQPSVFDQYGRQLTTKAD
ncbi:MAG TPA: ssDNA-binding protein, partial [Terriglobales bacterium]|nr:ssDNA-binding protein [Terriglobales bacterium]